MNKQQYNILHSALIVIKEENHKYDTLKYCDATLRNHACDIVDGFKKLKDFTPTYLFIVKSIGGL